MSRSVRLMTAVSIAVALALGTLGSVAVGFGVKTACTTFSDDLSACGRVDVAVWLHGAAQLGLAVVLFVPARRRRVQSVWFAVGGLVASLMLFGGFLALAESWRWS